ncbi:hypothetical protein TNCV_1695391 [Trichonephila clavipes]|nr:hypothetical protein TNCV_1695391 [Trichonephila clavipes]
MTWELIESFGPCTIQPRPCSKQFPPFPVPLGGKRFSDNEEVKAAMNCWLFDQAQDFFEEAFQNLVLSMSNSLDGTEDDYLFMKESNSDGENDTDFDDVPEDITEDEYADIFMLSNNESSYVCYSVTTSLGANPTFLFTPSFMAPTRCYVTSARDHGVIGYCLTSGKRRHPDWQS